MAEEISKKEKKKIQIEILEKIVVLTTSGFGLVAALAWNTAIQGIFKIIFGTYSNIWAQIGYAVIVTDDPAAYEYVPGDVGLVVP